VVRRFEPAATDWALRMEAKFPGFRKFRPGPTPAGSNIPACMFVAFSSDFTACFRLLPVSGMSFNQPDAAYSLLEGTY